MPTVAQVLSTREPTGQPVTMLTGVVLDLSTRENVGDPQWGTVTIEATDGATMRCLVPESLIVQIGHRVLVLVSSVGNFIMVRLSQPLSVAEEDVQ